MPVYLLPLILRDISPFQGFFGVSLNRRFCVLAGVECVGVCTYFPACCHIVIQLKCHLIDIFFYLIDQYIEFFSI